MTVREDGSKVKKDASCWSAKKSILAIGNVPSTISGRVQVLDLPISRTYGGKESLKPGSTTVDSVVSVRSDSPEII